ncbi:MAG: hypothetical protein Q4E16_04595 [Neisseria sp.]|nr:hypothetical protein [Neisseria sp.]
MSKLSNAHLNEQASIFKNAFNAFIDMIFCGGLNEQNAQNGILHLVNKYAVLDAENQQMKDKIKELEKENRKLKAGEANSGLVIIYALSETLKDKGVFKTNSQIIDYLSNENEKGYRGLSESTIKPVFAAANALIREMDKK